MKKGISLILVLAMVLISLSGCSAPAQSQAGAPEAEKAPGYKIGIVTPTLSTSEDEYRAGENMVAKYPDIVKHITLPENFNVELETAISQIVSLADDPEMKAVVVVSGQSGLLPALQKIEETRPEIITVTAPIWDDPDMMAQYIDINLDTDWARRGQTIVEKAHNMGAKTFIHYSFPTHLAKEAISKRKEMMKTTSEQLGMTFVEIVTPDPQAGDGGVPAMQQFLREDIPRQIEKYGVDTNIFGSNCPMYDVILDEALKLKFIMAEQCCPTPTQAFPTVMNLEIAAEDVGNFDKINAMISEKAADADMTGRLSGWPVPITIFLPEFAVEVAKDLIDSGKTPEEALSSEYLIALAQDKFGVGVEMNPMKPEMDNYYLTIMDSIFY
ncbi:DUF3798 domain-containing protein [Acidaminobacter sp.]|uniref:DUF3798 domain-containing protein n=1 Tax=Acidaminobacter sp. TaxID=1872102 RepID=UPI00137FE056|nr:DUF3798 domain-containing protein [Acidaminobacter sp.]MDK9710135.1 DUF3798 domain-containing protein [Acidaminobacter sp.]MZQ98779.1 DUF3798 domain-containing protein [Acidaminobacter sp.]